MFEQFTGQKITFTLKLYTAEEHECTSKPWFTAEARLQYQKWTRWSNPGSLILCLCKWCRLESRLEHFQGHWLSMRNFCFHTYRPWVDPEVTLQGGVDMSIKNMAVFTLIELLNTTSENGNVRIFPLLRVFAESVATSGLSRAFHYSQWHSRITMWIWKEQQQFLNPKHDELQMYKLSFFWLLDNPFMSPGCSPLKGACRSSLQASVFVSFWGIFSTFFLILLLFSLHPRPPADCISTISLSFIGQLPESHTLATFPQIQRPRLLLHIVSTSFR